MFFCVNKNLTLLINPLQLPILSMITTVRNLLLNYCLAFLLIEVKNIIINVRTTKSYFIWSVFSTSGLKQCNHLQLTETDITHCHVFDIHVSLPLQLSYYLPVEPLKLQVGGRDETKERKFVIVNLMGALGTILSALLSTEKKGKNAVETQREKMVSDHLECIAECVWGRQPSPRLCL